MYVTFKNNSTSEKIVVTVENQQLTIAPEDTAEVFCNSLAVKFQAHTCAFEEIDDVINEIDDNDKNDSFKDRVLTKLTKKFAKKATQIVLDTTVTYEASFTDSENAVVNLFEGAYSVCDGKIADALDLMPVGYMFIRAEINKGEIKVVGVVANNRKKFRKLMRTLLLFMNWNFLIPDLFMFIPEYLTVKFYSSNFYIKRMLCALYDKSTGERERILLLKEQSFEKEDWENKKNKKGGCLIAILKLVVLFLLLGGIIYWGMTNEPEIIISEDFSSVAYFDEAFVKIDGGLPADAKDVPFEDYVAYYPLSDGYDSDNYHCYIYETPDGTRYMWLKDGCTDIENDFKDYEDYENPLVYKSVGETAE